MSSFDAQCHYDVEGRSYILPVLSVEAHSTIVSTTSRTTLTQTFTNPNAKRLKEVVYTFPLYNGVSVVRFKCTIGDRIIEGRVKERNEAEKEYEAARDAGQSAALMKQAAEASDTFRTKIGNIPAKSSFKVEVVFIGELQQDSQTGGIRFTLPTKLAPRYGTVDLEESAPLEAAGRFSATIDVQLPNGVAVKELQSPSHPINVSIGNTSKDRDAPPSLSVASATLSTESSLDTDFVVIVVPSKTSEPAALLETHVTLPHQRALMTTIIPNFALPAETPEIVFICDRSGSMDGNIKDLKRALNIFVKSLPQGVRFNICSFGSSHSFLWSKSESYDEDAVKEAIRHIATFAADFGGTEMYAPLEDTFKRRHRGSNLEVFLLTDGGIWNQQQTLRLVSDQIQESNGAVRVFSLGIGSGASTALVEGIARAGNGFAQFVADKEVMDKKVVRMLKASLYPHITGFRLEVEYEGSDGDSDDFEIIDAQSTIVESEEESKGDATASVPEEADKPKATISLFDKDVNMDDVAPPEVKPLPTFTPQPYLQTPSVIPPLLPGSRSTIYVLLNEGSPQRPVKSVVLSAPSKHGELRLSIPVTDVGRGTTLHQLAARKECRELEDGRGFISRAADADGKMGEERFGAQWQQLVKREGVYYGLRYQIVNRWCSFVAFEKKPDGTEQVTMSSEVDVESDSDMMFGNFDAGPSPKRSAKGKGGPRNRPGMILFSKKPTPKGSAAMRVAAPAPAPLAAAPPGGAMLFGEAVPPNAPKAALFGGPPPKAAAAPAPAPVEAAKPQASKVDSNALEKLTALQRFDGSWRWTGDLQNITGVQRRSVATAAPKLDKSDDALATALAVAYLREKLADDEEVWELMVDKAVGWLTAQGYDAEEAIAAVQKIIK